MNYLYCFLHLIFFVISSLLHIHHEMKMISTNMFFLLHFNCYEELLCIILRFILILQVNQPEMHYLSTHRKHLQKFYIFPKECAMSLGITYPNLILLSIKYDDLPSCGTTTHFVLKIYKKYLLFDVPLFY